jgi:hypothetical protein
MRLGLRVEFSKVWGLFYKTNWEEALDCGLISVKIEGFFEKWSDLARSGPSACPIRQPRKVSDMDSPELELWIRYEKITEIGQCKRSCIRLKQLTGPTLWLLRLTLIQILRHKIFLCLTLCVTSTNLICKPCLCLNFLWCLDGYSRHQSK